MKLLKIIYDIVIILLFLASVISVIILDNLRMAGIFLILMSGLSFIRMVVGKKRDKKV